jgi:hypothetical protein
MILGEIYAQGLSQSASRFTFDLILFLSIITMSIKSIIIDNKQTTAKRIALDKVQLDLVALPLDEQNDTEPNLDIRLYVNGQLLKNLQSGAD